jgi:SAM-dependent methyltransferase
MERFNKKTMNIYSSEYDHLIQKEIETWSTYTSSDDAVSNFAALKNTHSYLTYRKGTIEMELRYIKNLGGSISVLELGSADGWLSNEIASLPNVKDITSIDISLENNKSKYGAKAYALRGDLNKIDEIHFDQKYMCIITHGTLHHLVDPKKTLAFCLDNLLLPGGILIVNDTWILKASQLKINACFYLGINKLGHALLQRNLKEVGTILFYKIPKVITNFNYANRIAHAQDTSPFESVSSADDYKELYERDDVQVLHFERRCALPGLQNSWMKSPVFVKKIIQTIDSFLIRTNLLPGDLHICIVKKV